jgi:tRNA(fMet)-specific endonuclease VapC
MGYLLDTNVVSAVIKNNSKIKRKLESIKFKGIDISISCITYFEIKRGLLAIDSPRQLERFEEFCETYKIIMLDDLKILEKSSEIHANLRLRGLPIQTEDILIAATAIVKELTLVSNDRDLSRVEQLKLEDWLEM